MRQVTPSPFFGKLLGLLALVVLLSAAVSPATWYFVPVAFAYLSISAGSYSVFAGLAISSALIFGAFSTQLFVTDLDYISLGLLLIWGWLLAGFRESFERSFKALGALMGGLIVIVLGLILAQESAVAWSEAQLNAQLLPILFNESSWIGDAQYYYNEVFRSLFVLILPGSYCFYLGLVFVFNLLLFRMTDPLRSLHYGFWEQFSRWRPPEWVLVPFVIGLGLLVVSYEDLTGNSWSWLLWIGWNLSIVSLYPIALNGLSIISYLLPRLGLFFVILTVFLFVMLNPYPFLILAGWADIWFDFRRRMRSNPKSE